MLSGTRVASVSEKIQSISSYLILSLTAVGNSVKLFRSFDFVLPRAGLATIGWSGRLSKETVH